MTTQAAGDVREARDFEHDDRPFDQQVRGLALAGGAHRVQEDDRSRHIGLPVHEFITQEFEALTWRVDDLVPAVGAF